MDASAKAGGAGQLPDEDEEMDEEEGDVVESAPPLQLGEERLIGGTDITKKLLKVGAGWETPEFGDEVTVHHVSTLFDGRIIRSTRDEGEPIILPLYSMVPPGLEKCLMSMKKGEIALFTFLSRLSDITEGSDDDDDVSDPVIIHYEFELISWITCVDVRENGIYKKILEKGNKDGGKPGSLDEVLVRYQVKKVIGDIVAAKTPDEGIEFCVKDGHLCPAMALTVVTMQPGEKAKLLVTPLYGFSDQPKWALSIDLELVSFKPVIDVVGDSKIFKKILRNGEGTGVADDGATVTVSYVAKLEDGTIFERKGFGEGEPFVFVTDEEQVISGLDKAAATMKKGEKVELTISPEYGFGNVEVQRDLARVPQCSTLIYEVEMLDFVKEKKPWEMNNKEKIEAAKKKKEEGNLLYKNQKYHRAAKKYDKAADCIENGSFEGDEEKQVKALRVSCFLNGAACSLKVKDFLETIRLCSEVLEIEFQNVKALYRRAQSFIETGDLVSAEMDIKKALEADPENRELKTLYKRLEQCKAESNKRGAKLYANMFAAPSKAL